MGRCCYSASEFVSKMLTAVDLLILTLLCTQFLGLGLLTIQSMNASYCFCLFASEGDNSDNVSRHFSLNDKRSAISNYTLS